MRRESTPLRRLLLFLVVLSLLGVAAIATTYLYLAPRLPSIESLRDVRLQTPMRIYSREGGLIAEYGEKRRTPVRYADLPDLMVKAFLSAEDDRFFEHPGVDYQGLLRAGVYLIRTGEKGQGGSTITMQVARNFFLSSEKTYLRKINEILLALKIERELNKQEILELYLNKIYLGNRAYGVEAAAQVYYGKSINQLNLAQVAMIAGLPKAPSRFNPVVNPSRALLRRNYVLGRMRELRYIDQASYQAAMAQPVTASVHAVTPDVDAPYVAEMVRAEMHRRLGDEIYTSGLHVYTTLDGRLQAAATEAHREALLDYDRRHGYRGPERRVEMEGRDEAAWDLELEPVPVIGGLPPGVVTAVGEREAVVYLKGGKRVVVEWEGLAWARPYIDDNRIGAVPERASDVVQIGDLVRVAEGAEEKWQLAQVPQVSGALVALSPDDGSLVALVGGFDFYQSKFNRATQALRQPGSNFKPFIYSAALEKGYTAASLINDAPVVFEDAALESTWRPENYSGKFFGPTRLRLALTKSRNLVSIRLLQAIGVDYAVDYVARFGFGGEQVPRNLSLALGSGTVVPLDLAAGYAVFANGGFRIEPHFIARVEDSGGTVLERPPVVAVCRWCEEVAEPGVARGDAAPPRPDSIAPRVLDSKIAYLMTSIMRDVVQYGTGRGALKLGRNDIAGKTGTTNDQRDAWFSGFNHALVATAWVGFDQVRPLGNRETGGRAALPMWTRFMAVALEGVPEQPLEQPTGLVTVRIDPESGKLAKSGQANAIFETFRSEYVPQAESAAAGGEQGAGAGGEALF